MGKVAIAVVALFVVPSSAFAHKLVVFAYVDGTSIRGNVYFRGSSPAKNVEVIARDPAGNELGRTTTDDKGQFTLPARLRVDHRIDVETDDGHGETYLVRAAELPDNLPGGEEPSGDRAKPPAPADAAIPNAEREEYARRGELASQVDALYRQIVELRGQVAENEQRVRFRDVLGGIGYIVGVTGVACFLLAMRRRS